VRQRERDRDKERDSEIFSGNSNRWCEPASGNGINFRYRETKR